MHFMTILTLPISVGLLFDIVGLTFLSGASLIGLFVLSRPPLVLAIVEKCEVTITHIFLSFFNIRIYLLADVHIITDWKQFALLVMIMITAYLSRMIESLLSLIFFKLSSQKAILFSFLLNSKGIVELLIIMLWRMHKVDYNFISLPSLTNWIWFSEDLFLLCYLIYAVYK